MIIYVSMLICPVIVYLFYKFTKGRKIKSLVYAPYASDEKIDEMFDKIPLIFCLVTFGYFIFWIGMRTYIADTSQYIWSFNSIPDNFTDAWNKIGWDGKSPGFDIFNVFFKSFISQDFQWWLMTIAIFSGLCVMYTLRKHSCNFFYSAFLFISIITFIWMMNGMRQFIAVAALFALSDWIKRGKFIPFVLAVLLFSTVHNTCLLMIPIYFVVRCKPWSGRIVAFLFVIILICIFAEPLFEGVDSVLEETNYAGIAQQIQGDDGVNPIRVAFYSVFPLVAYFYRNTLEKEGEKDPYINICINMSLITAALYLVGVFSSGILIGRLPIYCEVYNLILIPFMLKKCFSEKQKNLVNVIATLLFLAFFFTQMDGMPYVSDITGWVY